MRKLLNLLGSRRRRMEEDLDRELRYHLERRIADFMASGLSESEARRQAAIEFGGLSQVQEDVRDMWFSRWFHDLLRDVQYSGRILRKNPAFTLVAVLSLALGIGANAAIYGVFHAVLIRPLPYKSPDRLASIALVSPDSPDGFVMTPEFIAWRASTQTLEGLTAWNDEHFNLSGAGAPERIVGASVTADFLSVLGIKPALGRDFTLADDSPASGVTALLTHELWERRFGADPSVPGRMILLNDQPCIVAGVLPRGFRFPGDLAPEILVTSRLPAQPDWGAQAVGLLHVIGRVKPGVTAERARAELSTIEARHKAEMPGWMRSQRRNAAIEFAPLQERLAGDARPKLLILLGAVGLLLIIACVNVASLQLGRVAVRRREIGVRAALGASRARIARYLVIENLALAVLAGVAGLLIARGVLDALRWLPAPVRHASDFQMSWILGSAAFLLATLCGLAIGLAPALTCPKIDLNDVLKAGSRSLVSASGTRIRSVLVSVQLALALILLLGSGLLLRSLYNVLMVDPGFDAKGVITARLDLPASRYSSKERRAAFTNALVERVGSLPGVTAAGVTNSLPLTGYTLGMSVVAEGQPELLPANQRGAPVLAVTPDYFQAMGIRLFAGRFFDQRDSDAAAPVAIASSSFAKRFFSTENVIGKRVRLGASQQWATIVGVTGNVRHAGREQDAEPELFVPNSQMPSYRVNLAVRTDADPASLAASLRSSVWELDKDLPVYDIATMEERLSQSGEARLARTVLISSFALLAICLAVIGIYGVVAEAVQQRTGEIGLRMALGAGQADVRWMVMKRSLALVISGIVIGAAASVLLVRYLRSLLYGVEPTDVATLAGVGCLLLLVAMAAAYLPARRASRVDPLAALRCE